MTSSKTTTAWIVSCPDCAADLADEANAFWCPRCEAIVSYAKAAQDES